MERKQLEELGLDEEQVNGVMKMHGKSINEVKQKAEQAETLESQIEDYQQQLKDRDKQLSDLQKQTEGNDDLQQKIKDLQAENDQIKKDSDAKLKQQKKESKLELALKDANARNPKAVKALLNDDLVNLDDDGNLVGLSEQLDNLKESDAYLFEEPKPKGLQGKQPVPGDDSGRQKGISKDEFDKMSYTEKMKLYNDDLETYQKLTKGE